MNVLIACEESQTVCKEFRKLGHRAFSCDIQESSGGHPEWHIKGDVIHALNGNICFRTEDGTQHSLDGKWDLIIAHPPCTYFTSAGACRMFHKNASGESILDESRYAKAMEMKKLFMAIYEADCERIAIENPTPMKIIGLPRHNQVIQPYQFGDPWTKRTLLWLKGLPELEPTNIVNPSNGSWVAGDSSIYKRVAEGRAVYPVGFRDSKTRSKTFQGIARAMAEQWGVNNEDTK